MTDSRFPCPHNRWKGAADVVSQALCTRCSLSATEIIANQRQEIRVLEANIKGYQRECHEVEQILGRALGYPWFKDDPKNFPNATEADEVAVGEHTPWSIAAEAADRLSAYKARIAAEQEAGKELQASYLRIRGLVNAWNTPYAPSTADVTTLTEDKIKEIVDRLATFDRQALESAQAQRCSHQWLSVPDTHYIAAWCPNCDTRRTGGFKPPEDR